MLDNLKVYQQLFIRIMGILAFIAMAFFLFEKDLIYTSFFILFLTLGLLLELYFYLKNTFQFYDKTINAILQNDFSADFSKHKSSENYSSLMRLYEILKIKQNEKVSQDIIYQSILNNIETGILILQKTENDWTILLINDYFSKDFNVPKVSKWHYLKNQLPTLCTIIEAQNFQEVKSSLQIRINKREMQTFVMQSSRSKIFNEEYYIVLLDSIQKVIEKKKKKLGST